MQLYLHLLDIKNKPISHTVKITINDQQNTILHLKDALSKQLQTKYHVSANAVFVHGIFHTISCFTPLATNRAIRSFFNDGSDVYCSVTVDQSQASISPKVEEIETEGAEYMIALRGDPVSRAALLSCTIQTTLLLERCLDPNTFNNNDSISHGFFGRRTFVFTDDLDVTNRLYFGLLDAEGRNSNRTINANKRALASLRNNGASFSRYQGGQDWSMCEELGQDLNNRKLRVIRVSSQDPGVDDDADIVVATASLEVGFVSSFLPITTAPIIALRKSTLLISNGNTYFVNNVLPRLVINPISVDVLSIDSVFADNSWSQVG